jgi:hypothetical protein
MLFTDTTRSCTHSTRQASCELRLRVFECDSSWYDEYWCAEVPSVDQSLIAARIGTALAVFRRALIEAETALRRRVCSSGSYLVFIVRKQHGFRTW